MYRYRQPIVLFGIVVPIAITAVIIAVCFMLKSQMEASFGQKEKNYKDHQISLRSSKEIEARLIKDHHHLERWDTALAEEAASAVTTTLREISEHLPAKEIQQTAFERPAGKGGFGTVSAQNSSQVRIAFRGTFRTVQRAFLELESQMPRLQLQDLKIDPSSGQSSLLNFQVTYTAWEN